MKNRYRNPWVDGLFVKGPDFYENDATKVYDYQGVAMLWIEEADRFDFVFENCCIAQRRLPGVSTRTEAEARLRKVIEDIRGGMDPVYEEVAAHLRRHGWDRVLDYSQYTGNPRPPERPPPPKPLTPAERKRLVRKARRTKDGKDLPVALFERMPDADLRLWANDLSAEELDERLANSDFPEGLQAGPAS